VRELSEATDILRESAMAFLGHEIIPVAAAHVGERYVLGARAPFLNPNWRGPWDCAEFATWCAYQTYRTLFGAEPADVRRGDAFTGYWWDQSQSRGLQIDVARALATAGAFLLRRPRRELIGHVAISLGDGRIVEAAGARLGVVLRRNTPDRRWDAGVLLPGVQYGTAAAVPHWSPPNDIIRVVDPYMRGAQIAEVQLALASRDYDPGPVDGIYGELTEASVIALQGDRGLIVDGEVGPQTAAELALGWPIRPSQAATAAFHQAASEPAVKPAGVAPVVNPLREQPITFTFHKVGSQVFAKDQASGDEIFIGRQVPYKYGAISYRGLAHIKSSDLALLKPYGMYNRLREESQHGLWAHAIWPTVTGESDGYYARINTYDAGFLTFGCYQLAAHTPGDNLVLLFRELLRLPEAKAYFPDLALVDDRIHQKVDGHMRSLELAVEHPVGNHKLNTTGLAVYLNPDLQNLNECEENSAARLMHWCRTSSAMRNAQVRVAVRIARRKLTHAAAKVNLSGRPLDQCIWVNDILHQGRGGKQTYARIAAALSQAHPVAALKQIGGASFASRIAKVDECVQQLVREGTIANKVYEDLV
jgi:cell wall-associated NlpC family hydrolase